MTVPLQRTLNGYRLRILGAGFGVFIRDQSGVHGVSLYSEQILVVLGSSLATGLQRSSRTARVTVVPAHLLR